MGSDTTLVGIKSSSLWLDRFLVLVVAQVLLFRSQYDTDGWVARLYVQRHKGSVALSEVHKIGQVLHSYSRAQDRRCRNRV